MFLPAIVLLGPPLLNRLLAPAPRALPQRSVVGETTATTPANAPSTAVGQLVSLAWSGFVIYAIYKAFFAKGRR